MANTEIKSLAQILGTWLKEERGRLKIEFFNMEAEKWEKVAELLQGLFPEAEINQDVETIGMVLDAWMTRVRGCNDATILEIDLAARNPPNDLRFNQAARKFCFIVGNDSTGR